MFVTFSFVSVALVLTIVTHGFIGIFIYFIVYDKYHFLTWLQVNTSATIGNILAKLQNTPQL